MSGMKARLTSLEGQGKEQGVMVSTLKADVADLKTGLAALRTDMDRRFDNLDAKMTRQFMWLVGMQTLILVSIVGALAAMVSVLR